MDEEISSVEPVEAPAETTVDESPESDELLNVLSDTEDKPKETEEVVETDKEEATDEETEPEVEPKKEDEPEVQEVDPKEEARRRYEERQKVQAERKARVDAQAQQYINETDDATEQRLRSMEAQEYGRIIEHNENTLIGEFDRAKSNPDLQIFNPDSDQFNEKAYNYAIKNYNEAKIQYDANGNMIELKGSLYEHLTETAELLQGAVKTGQIKQVRDGMKMKANADTKPAAAPKEVKKDELLDILMSD